MSDSDVLPILIKFVLKCVWYEQQSSSKQQCISCHCTIKVSVTVQRPTLRKATIRKQYLPLNTIIQHYCTYCTLWLDMHWHYTKLPTLFFLSWLPTLMCHNERLANASKVFCVKKIYTHSPTSEKYNFLIAWCNKHLSWSWDSNKKSNMTAQSVTKMKSQKHVLTKKKKLKAQPLYSKYICTCILHAITQMATIICSQH
jgi:hypothetical protein